MHCSRLGFAPDLFHCYSQTGSDVPVSPKLTGPVKLTDAVTVVSSSMMTFEVSESDAHSFPNWTSQLESIITQIQHTHAEKATVRSSSAPDFYTLTLTWVIHGSHSENTLCVPQWHTQKRASIIPGITLSMREEGVNVLGIHLNGKQELGGKLFLPNCFPVTVCRLFTICLRMESWKDLTVITRLPKRIILTDTLMLWPWTSESSNRATGCSCSMQ